MKPPACYLGLHRWRLVTRPGNRPPVWLCTRDQCRAYRRYIYA